jgi:hypothetical protein
VVLLVDEREFEVVPGLRILLEGLLNDGQKIGADELRGQGLDAFRAHGNDVDVEFVWFHQPVSCVLVLDVHVRGMVDRKITCRVNVSSLVTSCEPGRAALMRLPRVSRTLEFSEVATLMPVVVSGVDAVMPRMCAALNVPLLRVHLKMNISKKASTLRPHRAALGLVSVMIDKATG